MKDKIVFEIIAYLYFNISGQTLFAFMPEYLKKDLFMHLLCILTLLLFSKRSTVFIKYALVVKENEILKRQLEHNGIKVKFNNSDRRFFSFILNLYPRARKLLTFVTPATVLYKWKCIYKKRWTFLQKQKSKLGRPSITMKIRKLILEMKKLNPLWGYRHISGELDKIDIDVSKDTIARIIRKGRKDGDILPTGSWKRFITAHIKSLYCCDFFCIDTVFNKRLYIFFIMEIKTRRIIQYGVTTNPNMHFVRNQFTSFMYDRQNKTTHLIHDNSGELKYFDYKSLGITEVKIAAYSPNLNAFAERFVRSVKTECFDYFIVLTSTQARNIMREYVKYFNRMKPHQGINNKVPENWTAKNMTSAKGKIKKGSAVFGLYTVYSKAA